jgi:FAD:protein FMN transferase
MIAPTVPKELRVYARPRMGTLLALTLQGSPSMCDEAARRAFDLAADLDRVMTRFSKSSDLNRVGQAAGRFVPVPAELAGALRLARRLAAMTGGAFDPTVGPLVDVWRRVGAPDAKPPQQSLGLARASVGWRRLDIRERAVRLREPGMALDLDGFGKGWAADRIARALRRFAGLAALVNFGESSIVAVGSSSRGRGWPIVVRGPRGGFAGWFTLANSACSTSATQRWTSGRRGDAAPCFIDPRSGRRLPGIAQVTVVARTAAVAEAASTAMLVLGRPSMESTASRLTVEACWIDREGITTTRGFQLKPITPRELG